MASSEIKHLDRFATIRAEEREWRRIMDLPGEQILDVYLDLKSPHAYLAVRPALLVARDYRVRVNFLPFTLSYEAFGLTTAVQPDMQRRPPSAAADRKARMYYAAAREYAALQGLPFRTPYRLLDSELAHKCMLYAKTQRLDVPFVMLVYLYGWGSGWRNYELESKKQLSETLAEVGADLHGLDGYVKPGNGGDSELVRHTEQAIESGWAGVPHFVFDDPRLGRRLGLFGREHLALIRGKYHAQGLARHEKVRPEFSHAWNGSLLNQA